MSLSLPRLSGLMLTSDEDRRQHGTLLTRGSTQERTCCLASISIFTSAVLLVVARICSSLRTDMSGFKKPRCRASDT